MDVIPFSAMNGIPTVNVGSKARNLVDMLKSGFPVPPGFVVTNQAFQLFLEENGLLSQTNDQDFQDLFFSRSLPQPILQDIRNQYKILLRDGFTAVAVRSSSSFEDLCSASFAGQYETFLNICSFEDVLLHIKKCWYSVFSSVVQGYAKHQGISNVSPTMGVIVQGMIHADVSGVIFSKHPVTNNKQEMVINAAYGLGESIVAGLVTPDYFNVCKQTRMITKELGFKEIKMVPGTAGTTTVVTTLQEQLDYCLNDEMIQELAELTLRIEKKQKGPVDIEFAIQDGTIFLLQVRPITT